VIQFCCQVCNRHFTPHPKSHHHQKLCGRQSCRRAYKSAWEKARRRESAAYYDCRHASQRQWSQNHPDYWFRYRASHPEYADRNRALQRARDQLKRVQAANTARSEGSPPLAKVDRQKTAASTINTGFYHLVPIAPESLAKVDRKNSVIVNISVV